MSGLERLKYHVADDAAEPGPARPASTFRGADEQEGPSGPFNSDEAAARFFLDKLLQTDERPSMRSAAAPDEPGTVPGMVLASQQELPGTGSHLLRFDQSSGAIPVFGGEAVVELDPQRALLSVDLRLGDVPGIGASPSIDGAEAVRMTAEHLYEIVLMDVQMPVMDGLDATRAIRQREMQTKRHQKILAMTANAMRGDRDRCLEAGMDGYVLSLIHI